MEVSKSRPYDGAGRESSARGSRDAKTKPMAASETSVKNLLMSGRAFFSVAVTAVKKFLKSLIIAPCERPALATDRVWKTPFSFGTSVVPGTDSAT